MGSSDFVLKYGLKMLIEGGIRTRSRGIRFIRSVGWENKSTRTKTRLRSWGAWAERWFGWEVEVTEVI